MHVRLGDRSLPCVPQDWNHCHSNEVQIPHLLPLQINPNIIHLLLPYVEQTQGIDALCKAYKYLKAKILNRVMILLVTQETLFECLGGKLQEVQYWGKS